MRGAALLPPDRWQRLRALLDDALTVPPGERAAWLDALGPADADVQPRLRALLDHAGADTTDLAAVALGGAGAGVPAGPARSGVETGELVAAALHDPAIAAMTDRVGPYHLRRELGRGGMASVWLAERQDMLQARQVALKLPHGSWQRAGLDERLQREREILAGLEHPNIARLYDAGVTAEGQPWLALEFVEGERIDHHCAQVGLDAPARLSLFLQAARAVAHAHARLVVHRDIKPANILVDGAGQVKLLDFGIAKLLDQGVAASTELTQQAGHALTPQYASPEQLRGEALTTASDQFSLGVVLYELLTGTRPFGLEGGSRVALEHAVQHDEPRRPSSVVSAPQRHSLRGDIDTIVLRCLKKAPAERYATVDALADDIERHLQQRPVLARPDTAGYRLRRFVARNRFGVAASAAVLTALCAGTVVAWWQATEARSSQQRAETVKSFVADLLTDADPYETSSTEPTVKAMLEAAFQRLPPPQPGNAALRVELLNLIGGSLSGLSDFDRAEPILVAAVAESRRELGDDHELTLAARLLQTTVERFRGRTDAIRVTLDELVPALRSRAESRPQLLRDALTMAAHLALDEGRNEAADTLAVEALALPVPADRRRAREEIGLLSIRAQAALAGGDAEQTVKLTRDLRERALALHGGDAGHAAVLDIRMIYGRALLAAERNDEAAAELGDLLARAQRALGQDAVLPGFVAINLARAELGQGDAAASLRHAELGRRIMSRHSEPDSFNAAVATAHMGVAELALAHADAAERSFAQAIPILVKRRGADHPYVHDVSALHAWSMALQGRMADASALVESRLEAYRSIPAPFNFRGLHLAGLLRRWQGDLAGAEALQVQALATLDGPAPMHQRRAAVAVELARLALERGDATAALARLEKLPRPPSDGPARSLEEAEREFTRGRALLAVGQAEASLPSLHAADDFWAQARAAPRWRGEVLDQLVAALTALGRTGEAAAAHASAAQLQQTGGHTPKGRLARTAGR